VTKRAGGEVKQSVAQVGETTRLVRADLADADTVVLLLPLWKVQAQREARKARCRVQGWRLDSWRRQD